MKRGQDCPEAKRKPLLDLTVRKSGSPGGMHWGKRKSERGKSREPEQANELNSRKGREGRRIKSRLQKQSQVTKGKYSGVVQAG